MAGRTWEKTANGRFTPAGVARSQRAGQSQRNVLGFKNETRLGVTPKHPNGKFTNAQAQKMIKNGDKVKMNVAGKDVTVKVTKANRDEVIKSLTANEKSSPTKNFLVNAGKETGEKATRGTTKVFRGTADNPKITSRGSERGRSPIIKQGIGDAAKESGKGGKGTTTNSSTRLPKSKNK